MDTRDNYQRTPSSPTGPKGESEGAPLIRGLTVHLRSCLATDDMGFWEFLCRIRSKGTVFGFDVRVSAPRMVGKLIPITVDRVVMVEMDWPIIPQYREDGELVRILPMKTGTTAYYRFTKVFSG